MSEPQIFNRVACHFCEVKDAEITRLKAFSAGRGMVSEAADISEVAVLVVGLHERIAQVEQERDALHADLDLQIKRTEEARNERDALRAANSHFDAEILRLTTERETMRVKVAKQVEELNTIIRQKWEIEGERDALRRANAKFDAEILRITVEREALRADLKACAGALDDLMQKALDTPEDA